MFSHINDRHCQKCNMHFVWVITKEPTKEEIEEMPWVEDGGLISTPKNAEEEKEAQYYCGGFGENEYDELSERDALDLWGSAVCEDCEKWLRERGFDSMFDCFEDDEEEGDKKE